MKLNKLLLAGSVMFSLFSFGEVAWAEDGAANPVQPTVYPYEKTYTITAYYSPIEGQKRYLKGSLAADKKLNGNGVHGADGTDVYPGMIAAPKSVPFGTKMNIPGLGLVAVHDRGGAIVHAGDRGGQYDRLDVWMGYGDEGLNRALRWGKRQVKVTVYGIDESIQEKIDLSTISGADLPGKAVQGQSQLTFRTDYGYGDKNEEIPQIKQKLKDLSYYKGQIDNQYDTGLYQAVLDFQLKYGIVDDENDFGAGYFGPQTRKTLEKAMNGLQPSQEDVLTVIAVAKAANNDDAYSEAVQLAGNGLSFLAVDLRPGDSGQSVVELQTELRKLNLFGLEPTGNYGEVTAHAVFKFQQGRGLVGDLSSPGAGVFGPVTREELRALVSTRIETRKTIASNGSRKALLAQK